MTKIIQTEQLIFRKVSGYTEVYVIAMRKEVMNMKEGCMRGFEGRNGREKFCNYMIISKIKQILQSSVSEAK